MCEPTEMKITIKTVESPEKSKVIQYEKCQGCGCSMHPDAYNEYRVGYWCSRSCAYYDSYDSYESY